MKYTAAIDFTFVKNEAKGDFMNMKRYLRWFAVGAVARWIAIAAISFLTWLVAAQKAGAAMPPVVPVNEHIWDEIAFLADCIVCVPICAVDPSGVACATCLTICLATPT